MRHRAPLIDADLSFVDNNINLKLTEPQRVITPGQSVVVYDGEVCVGGGIVA
jgi:tRNA-specific 2-thiouridylase